MAISTQTTTTAATPTTIKVQIRKDPHHGGWTIEPEDRAANNGRFGEVAVVFFPRREQRHPTKPIDHNPIVFNEGDTLTFTCTPPFAFEIGAKKDETVDKIPSAPDNPFGWNGPQSVPAGGSVSGLVAKSTGVKDQAFYKFYGSVFVNGVWEPADPDGYCGS